MRAKKINSFEKLAMECEVREHPADDTVALAFTDWLMEHGFTLIGAKRHVTTQRRIGTEAKQRDRVERVLTEDGLVAYQARRVIRGACTADPSRCTRIEVVCGGSPPASKGEADYMLNLNTGEISRRWNECELGDGWMYIAGAVAITVGAAWVVAHCDLVTRFAPV